MKNRIVFLQVRCLLWWRDCRGATAVEYVLLASAVAGAIAASFFLLGDSVVAMFDGAAEAMAEP